MKCNIPEIIWHNRDPILSVDFQPVVDGSVYRLATGGTDSHVLIWLVTIAEKGDVNLEFASDLKRHNRAVNVVRFSPSGELLASGDDEAAIWLWKQQDEDKDGGDLFFDDDVKENKEHWTAIRTLRGHIEDVYDLCWSPNSNFLVSGSVDNSAIIWDIVKGRNIGLLSEHKGFVQGVAWDPQDQYVATLCSDRVCRIYSVANKRVVHKIYKANLSQTVTDVPINSTPPQKASRLFHDDTLKSFFRRLVFTPDGELLITPTGIVEVDGGSVLNVTHVFSRHSLTKPAFYLPSMDKHTLAVRCCPTLFQLRPIKRTEDVADLGQSQPWEIYSTLLKLPYRMVFAVATQDSVLFYDTQQPTPFAKVANIQYTRLSDLSWSSDGRILIVSSTDGYCSLVTFDKNELGIAYKEESIKIERSDIVTPKIKIKKLNQNSSSAISSQENSIIDMNISPAVSDKSQATTPIPSPVQQTTGRKRVSLITLFSPKSANKKGALNLGQNIKPSVVKRNPTKRNDEPLSMDVYNNFEQDVTESLQCLIDVVVNELTMKTDANSRICETDTVESELVSLKDDIIKADTSSKIIPSVENDCSSPSTLTCLPSIDIKSSSDTSCTASQNVRQPRRVQLVTLSTTPKAKK